jgi:membrane associated rhomboid family serine protease
VTGVAEGAYWQPLTAMFTHVEIWHIGFNMLALWFLGPQLEAAIGRARFLGLYLLAGLCGSAVVYWFAPLNSLTVGASGAIFGLMGGLLVIGLKVKADLSQLLIWIGLNFLITVLGRGFISWQGHLGGFLGGALVAAIIAYAPRRHRRMWQGLGFGVLAVALVAAYVVRTAVLT